MARRTLVDPIPHSLPTEGSRLRIRRVGMPN